MALPGETARHETEVTMYEMGPIEAEVMAELDELEFALAVAEILQAVTA